MLILHPGFHRQIPSITVIGELCGRAVIAMLDRHELACRAGRGDVILDLSGAVAREFHFGDAQTLCHQLQRRDLPGPGMRVALVAPQPLVYGVCRMLQELGGIHPERIGVHTCADDAAEWLGGALAVAS